MKYIIYLFFFSSSIAFGQSFSLGENYLDQGEFEKAKSIFKSLYEKQPHSQKYLLAYTKSLTELEQLEEAEQVLLEYLESTRNYPNIDVELGQIYQLQNKNELAEERYQIAIASIQENPNYAYAVGQSFQEYNLLDQAALVYEKADELQPRVNYKIQLARIYGEQGKLEKMFLNYIYLILESPNYFNVVSRNFNEYITEDPNHEANIVFKKLLLKELQREPNVLYNQLLSWLFVQEREFSKAFAQEKAIYKRTQISNLQRIIELGEATGTLTKDFIQSEPMFTYVVEESNDLRVKLQAIEVMMQQKTTFANTSQYAEINQSFLAYFEGFGRTPATAKLQLMHARFSAFQMNQREQAKEDIERLLTQNINRFTEANAKILLADIYVLEEQFNQALVYYSQVERLVKNTDLAQEAKFKVAKTSYYKGDFEWALTQLDVLKKASSQLIANDAMSLARHIKDNSYQDSIQTALQKVAKADLLEFQEENELSLKVLDEVLTEFNGQPVEDEALFRKAKIQVKLSNYEAAAEAYRQIIDFHPLDVLADDALFAIAELYKNELNLPEKAKSYYEKIIFDHPDSIYFVDAQKSFRKLRGDAIK